MNFKLVDFMNVDNETIKDLIMDISSWSNLYLVPDVDSIHLTVELKKVLDSNGISYTMISPENLNDLLNEFKEGDCLLAISKTGEDKFVLQVAELAISKNLKVYALSNRENSTLAFLAQELLFIPGNFDEAGLNVINLINDKLNRYLNYGHYDLEMAHPKAPPSPIKRKIIPCILWAVIILIILLALKFIFKF